MKDGFKKIGLFLTITFFCYTTTLSQNTLEGFWDLDIEYQCSWGWKDSNDPILLSKGFGSDFSGMIFGGTLEINHPFDNSPYYFKISGQADCIREGKLEYHQFAGTEYLRGEWLANGGNSAMWGTGLCCNGKIELSREIKNKTDVETKKVNTPKKTNGHFDGTLQEGQKYILKNVLFELSSSELLPESFPELQELYKVLNANQNIVIELEGHTDIDGRKKDNLKLSKSRVKSVKKYLTKKGIKSNRIKLKWYGSSRPLRVNGTVEERKINRRVEVNVLKLQNTNSKQ